MMNQDESYQFQYQDGSEYGEEAMDEMENPPDYNFKIILVGNKRVGKTSITNRCVFDEFNENSQSTRVVQVVPKTMSVPGTNKTAQLHIWDTLG